MKFGKKSGKAVGFVYVSNSASARIPEEHGKTHLE